MGKKQKVLTTLLVVGLAAVVGGFGIFAAFSDTTSNPGNSFAAGSVEIGDNDNGTALFSSAEPQKPGNYDGCILVTYTGDLDADVKLYSTAITGTGSGLNLTVERGTGEQADCSDFTAYSSGAEVYNGTLANFSSSHSGWSDGLAVNPDGATKWVESDEVSFRFSITFTDSDQGKSVNDFDLTWEAQNQ